MTSSSSSSSLLLDPRLESMRDSHERSTGIIVNPASPQDADQKQQLPQQNNKQSTVLQDLATISRSHIDPNNPNQDPQTTIRQFQAADPERFNQILKSIPGALQQMQSQSQQDVPMPPPGQMGGPPMHNGNGAPPSQSGPPPPMYAPHPDDPQHPQHPHHHHYAQHAAAAAAHAHAHQQQQMASGSGTRHSADLSAPSRSGSPDDHVGVSGGVGPTGAQGSKAAGQTKGRKRRDGVNSEDWARVRKDNHKEVERRRRGTINQGINELGMIVPNAGTGERAKGAVLNRAVVYIRQLKENEARNIEKWTLEKLLMDQAMSDLQAQMEDMRRRWDDDRSRLGMMEHELADVRAQLAAANAVAATTSEPTTTVSETAGNKRQRVE